MNRKRIIDRYIHALGFDKRGFISRFPKEDITRCLDGRSQGANSRGLSSKGKEILPRQRTKKQQQHRKASEHARQTPTQVQQPIRFSLLPCCPSLLVRYKTELNKTRAHSSSEWLAPEHESRIGNEILVCEIYRLTFFSFLKALQCYKVL